MSSYRCSHPPSGFHTFCLSPTPSFDPATVDLDRSSIRLPYNPHSKFLAEPCILKVETRSIRDTARGSADRDRCLPSTRFPMNKIDSISSDKISMLDVTICVCNSERERQRRSQLNRSVARVYITHEAATLTGLYASSFRRSSVVDQVCQLATRP